MDTIMQTPTKSNFKTRPSLFATSSGNQNAKKSTKDDTTIQTETKPAIAATKVLGIPELLEAILLGLPPRNLMRLRKVSTNFKATVERSVQIQQKISFKSIDLPRDGMVTINPLLLPILRHYGVVVIVTTLIKAQLNFCIRENDENQLRVYFNERIELVIVSIDKRIFTKACLPQTFKKMLVTDWLIDIGVVGHCNGDLDRSATLGDLIKSCNKRSTAIQSSSRGLSGRQLGEDYRSRKYEPKSMVVRRSSHYDVDRRGETEGC